jgi:hypothetical protein
MFSQKVNVFEMYENNIPKTQEDFGHVSEEVRRSHRRYTLPRPVRTVFSAIGTVAGVELLEMLGRNYLEAASDLCSVIFAKSPSDPYTLLGEAMAVGIGSAYIPIIAICTGLMAKGTVEGVMDKKIKISYGVKHPLHSVRRLVRDVKKSYREDFGSFDENIRREGVPAFLMAAWYPFCHYPLKKVTKKLYEIISG